ncbi:unnamed protein product [Owenia fusiformis]|uniref:Uncharacterized protein n=1 Tax=Owenia fusiformis TaxID=6347 RepID=A0A8J1TFU9_OWEFU|nr:unnamed protein product [Owenia fusiformis]
MSLAWFAILTAAVVCIGTVGAGNGDTKDRIKCKEDCSKEKELADAINKFGIEICKKISEQEKNGTNVFFSPVSIATALAMVLLGADGDTKSEMEDVLHVTDIQKNSGLHSMYSCLNKNLYGKTNGTELRSANKLYPDETLAVRQRFITAIETYYKGSIEELDFKQSAQATDIINKWVADQTNQLIKEVLQPGDISAMTVFALVNAIYFRGDWVTQFNPCDTNVQSFYVQNNVTVEVDMMYQEAPFKYFHDFGLKAQFLDLPYIGDRLSMVIILPDEKDGMKDLIEGITHKNLEVALRYLQAPNAGRDVYVSLPKMKFKWKNELSSILEEMGMEKLFSSAVDLSGFSKDPRLDVSKVIHEAFVDVNEKGTEAAAVTVIAGGRSGYVPPPVKVNCNHPFMFLIYDKTCGVILFIGKVTNPPSASNTTSPKGKTGPVESQGNEPVEEKEVENCRAKCREECYFKLLNKTAEKKNSKTRKEPKPKPDGQKSRPLNPECEKWMQWKKMCRQIKKDPQSDPFADLFRKDFIFLRNCKGRCNCKRTPPGPMGRSGGVNVDPCFTDET